MKHRIIFSILALLLVLPLMVMFLPALPALAAPQVNLSPTSGAKGTEITVTAANFASYTGDAVYILFGDAELADSPLIVPDDGTFEITFDVPLDAKAGIAYVTVYDQNGIQLGKSNPFKVVASVIRIEPEDGNVGTAVTIEGKGIYASRKVTFYYLTGEARLNMGAQVASPTGECTYSFTIPDSVGGSHQIIAQDAGGNEIAASFEVIPQVSLDPIAAPIGAELVVSGTGFGYKSEVTVYLGNAGVVTGQTDEYGSFEFIFDVPPLKTANYDIGVEDTSGNMDKAPFSLIAGISLSKNSGHIGEKIAVFGTGFITGQAVNIGYDASSVAEGIIDGNGSFSVIFSVPASKHGNHQVTASDGVNLVAALFNVESTAPKAPELLLPLEATKAKSDAYFAWKGVTDPSGVAYALQVASDADFSSIILEKTGIGTSSYQIAKEEKLHSTKKEAPYYWRVKAVDLASNESEWSRPGSFYVGFSLEFPGWVVYTLIGLGAVLIAFIFFKLGRRTAYDEGDTF